MEKKIKSVKLLKDLPGVPAETVGRFKERTEINDIYEFLRTIDFGVNFMKDFPTWFEIEYEPERKFIDVRIECDEMFPNYPITFKNIEAIVATYKLNDGYNFKVTELPK